MRYGKAFLQWLPLAFAITLLCALVYATVQQNYRQSLNDPQIQMAEDASSALSDGADVTQVVPDVEWPIDISASLAPWLAVLRPDGTIYHKSFGPDDGEFGGYIASSGLLPADRRNPTSPKGDRTEFTIPEGVLQHAQQEGMNKITWQPDSHTREAIVVVPFASTSTKGFVVAGRNMREVESREGALTTMILLAWLVALIGSLALQLSVTWYTGGE